MRLFKNFNALEESAVAQAAGLERARDKKSYSCPKCGNGLSGKKGDGIRQQLYDKRLIWHCYSCGAHMSNVDVFMAARGVKDVSEAARLIEFEMPLLKDTDWTPPTPTKEKPQAQKDCSRLYSWWRHELHAFVESQGGKWRGLTYKTLFEAGVGYNPKFKSVVIPYDKTTFLWRAVEGSNKRINKGGRRQLYMATPMKAGGDTFNFMCEGEVDALSLKQVLRDCLDTVGIAATGGIGSARRVVEELNAQFGDTADKPKIFWAGDNDSREATAGMIRALREAGYPSIAFYFADGNVKLDANDFLRDNGDDELLDFLIAVVDSQWRNLSTALSVG